MISEKCTSSIPFWKSLTCVFPRDLVPRTGSSTPPDQALSATPQASASSAQGKSQPSCHHINYKVITAAPITVPSNQFEHKEDSPHTSRSVPTASNQSSHYKVNSYFIKSVLTPSSQPLYCQVSYYPNKSVFTPSSQLLYCQVSYYLNKSVFTPSGQP